MNKFEQLVEYVINDEADKARELFHEIVVEKSRSIYEQMMEDEELDEAKKDDGSDEELDEAKDEDLDESEEELDEADMGGDQADDLIDDVEVEEEGLSMEGEEDEFADEEGEGDGNLEDRVVDLEDQLDQLMSEFEALMGDEGGEVDFDAEADGEFAADAAAGMDDEEIDDTELETEGMLENVSLKAVAKPSNTAVSSKSIVAANSGARGALAKPVRATGTEAQGRPAPTAKDAIGKVGNSPAQSTQKPTPATKPQLGQAAGVNSKAVIQ